MGRLTEDGLGDMQGWRGVRSWGCLVPHRPLTVVRIVGQLIKDSFQLLGKRLSAGGTWGRRKPTPMGLRALRADGRIVTASAGWQGFRRRKTINERVEEMEGRRMRSVGEKERGGGRTQPACSRHGCARERRWKAGVWHSQREKRVAQAVVEGYVYVARSNNVCMDSGMAPHRSGCAPFRTHLYLKVGRAVCADPLGVRVVCSGGGRDGGLKLAAEVGIEAHARGHGRKDGRDTAVAVGDFQDKAGVCQRGR